jgi:hypothetical protein
MTNQSEVLSSTGWRSAFPRLASLYDGASPTPEDTFFHGIPYAVENLPLACEVYQVIESDLAVLDGEAWNAFRAKTLRSDVRSHNHRGYANVCNTLNEAKGYRRLRQELQRRNLKYDRIVLIPEDPRRRTPDWGALLQGQPVAALEVKTIQESDDFSRYVDRNTRSLQEDRGAIARRACPRIPDALWNKLRSTVEQARGQLSAYAPSSDVLRIAMLIVQLDREQSCWTDNYAAIASFLEEQSDGLFRVVCEFKGWKVAD